MHYFPFLTVKKVIRWSKVPGAEKVIRLKTLVGISMCQC